MQSLFCSRHICGLKFLIIIALMVMNILIFGQLGNRSTNSEEEVSLEEQKDLTLMKNRLLGPIMYDDPDLLAYIRKTLHPPSVEPYNLRNQSDEKDPYNYHAMNAMPLFLIWEHLTRVYFKNKTGGFFVEAGALDGQYLSNTLKLEKEQNWTGLLVEPNNDMYKRILEKNRRAWVSNSCLATKPYPHQSTLITRGGDIGAQDNLIQKGMSALLESPTAGFRQRNTRVLYQSAQCFPVASLLLSLNVTKVDFFSLDVEDVEVDIIDNFPFDRITVDIWFIEHRVKNKSLFSEDSSKNDPSFIKKFTSRGYVFHRYSDYLFIRNNSGLLLEKPPNYMLKKLQVFPST